MTNDTTESVRQAPGTEKEPVNGRRAEGPATAMSVRLWAFGGAKRRLRDFAWKPQGKIAEFLGALVHDGSGGVVETRQNLVTLYFDGPQRALAAARKLQQGLLAAGPAEDGTRVVAAIAVHAKATDPGVKRRGVDSSTGFEVMRRPLKDIDIPQILVTEQIYKLTKDVQGFQFNDRPRRGAGGSRISELMYTLSWIDDAAYSNLRQEVYHASLPRFSRYAISSELGRGTMGVVYKAHDQSIDRMVALKTISLNANADTEESVERLRQEAKAAGSLDHPNIITIYDVGQEDGFFYLSMQFVEGTTLSSLMASGKRIPMLTVLSYVDQICNAVSFAHQRGIIHRDLKPSNMMLTSQGAIKVLDFGIAKLGNAGMTQAGMVVGTPSYMAPEQAMGRKVDQRSDIFSLGAVFYELFTGKRPFGAEDVTSVLYKVVHEDPPAPVTVAPILPLGIDAIIRRALAKNPQERFQTCDEMRQAFRDQAKFLRPTATAVPVVRSIDPEKALPPVTTTTRARAVAARRPRRNPWAVVFTWLAVAAMAAGFWAGRAHWKAQILALTGAHPGASSAGAAPATGNPVDTARTQSASAAQNPSGLAPSAVQTQTAQGQPLAAGKPQADLQAGSPEEAAGAPASGASGPDASGAQGATGPADAGAIDGDNANAQPEANNTTSAPRPAASSTKPANSKPSGGKSTSARSRPASRNESSIDGFSRNDIPALLRKADAAAGRGEYAVARYEYTVILKLDRKNPGALAGLRHVTAAEKEKSR